MSTPNEAGMLSGGGDNTRGAGGAGGAVAVILARAGSKGVPGKNVAMVGGKPCVEWTILAARESRSVGDIVLSTDCPRAASIGERFGVHVVHREAGLASDTARVDDAARDAVVRYEQAYGAKSGDGRGAVVILYANVPVRPVGLIDECVRVLEATGAESVQSYTGVGKHHPWWTCVVDEDGAVRPFDASGDGRLFHGVHRRQLLPAAHVPDGGAMVVTRRALMLEVEGVESGPHAFLGADSMRRGVITPEGSVVDIDSPIDVIVADAVIRGRSGAARWERRLGPAARRAG